MPARICPSIGWFSVSVTAASPLAETAAGDTARTRRTLLRHRRVSEVTEMRGPTRGLHCNDDCRIADEAGAHDGFEDATPRALRARASRGHRREPWATRDSERRHFALPKRAVQ